jgi:outer membrane protein assembly factor BamA
MFYTKPCLLRYVLKIFIPALVLFFTSSCVTFIKKYPKNKPFVYKTNINLSANLSKKEKNNLLARLKVQLEDSIQAKASQKLIWQTIKKPPVFDTSNANRSITFMRALLHSLGYFRDSVSYDTTLEIKGNQYRTSVNFNVKPGPVTILDSVWYNIRQPEMQRLVDSTNEKKNQAADTIIVGVQVSPWQKLADSTSKESLLHKGSTFSQDTISMDLDRLVELFRNNGYMRFTRNELIGVWDTLDTRLLQPAFDPIEQIKLLNELAERRKHPTATLEIRLKPGGDSLRMIKYYVGKVYIFPDYSADTSLYKTVELDSTFSIKYHQNLFKPKALPRNIYLIHGEAYNQNRYIKTINRLNTLIAWRLVNIEQKARQGTDTVDFNVRLTPAKKYLFIANLEGSRNDNNLFAEGNLLGLGVNLNFQNRNFAKSANQENIAIRYGTELGISSGQNFVNSRQASIGYNIFFPHFVPDFKFIPEKFRDVKTLLAFNLSNTQRFDYYNLTTFNTYLSYEYQQRNKIFAVKILNVEYSVLDSLSKLRDIFRTNPGLRNIFNDGLIVSSVGSFIANISKGKNLSTVKANLEESGLITGIFKNSFISDHLYRFIKMDGEYIRLIKIRSSEFVIRTFAGVGIELNTGNPIRSSHLPFFRAYGAGGSNSMRGWGLRRLGPGSSSLYYNDIPDRFGDIQFETNLEYRFHAFDLFGFHFNSVLFTDIGNVWFLKSNPDFPNGEFHFKNFFRDLGVDVGTGIRLDLGFFLIRLDYAFKVANPSPEPSSIQSQFKWFYGWSLKTLLQGTVQFGVRYPF